MRITSLTFTRVGHWESLPALQLGRGVTVVLGDNEAGKSTAVRALEALFFGPSRELVAPLQRVASFDAEATVQLDPSGDVRLQRRGKTWATPLEPALASLLAEGHAPRFRDVFRITHATVRGEARFLTHDGPLGTLLLAATTGVSAAHIEKLRVTMASRFEHAMSGAKGKDGLKLHAGAWAKAEAALQDSPRFATYDHLSEQIDRLEGEIIDAEKERDRLGDEARHLGTLSQGLVQDEILGAVQAELDELTKAGPTPSRDWSTRIEAVAGTLEDTRAALRDANAEEERADAAVRDAGEVSPLAGFAEEARSLAREAATLTSLWDELSHDAPKLTEARDELKRLVSDLGDRGDEGALVSRAEALVVPAPRRRELEEALTLEAKLRREVDEARRQRTKAQLEVEEARPGAAILAPRPVDALLRALAELQEIDRLSAERGAKQLDEQALRTSAAEASSRLGLAALEEPEILRLKLARESAIREALRARDEAREDARRLRERLAEAEARLGEARAKGRALEVGEPVVTQKALAAARRQRDEAFATLTASWTSSLREGGSRELPRLERDYVEQVDGADRLADLRFSHAQRLGQLDEAKHAEQSREDELSRTKEELERVEARAVDEDRAYADLFPFLLAPPSDPEAWLREHAQLCSTMARVETTAAHVRRLDEDLAARRRDLRTLLVSTAPSLAELELVPTLRSELERGLRLREEHNQRAGKAAAVLAATEARLHECERSLTLSEEELSRWGDAWSELSRGIPAAIGPDVAVVRDWLARQRQLADALKKLDAHEANLKRREDRIAKESARVRELRDRILAIDPTLSAIATLREDGCARELERLTERAAEERRTLEEATKRQRAARDRRLDLATKHEAAKEELAEQAARAGLGPAPTALERESATRRITRVYELDAQRDRILAALKVHWPMGLDAARTEIAGRSEAQLTAARDELAEHAKRADARRSRAIGDRRALETRRSELGAEARYAEVLQQIADARARSVARAVECLELEVAEWLLGKAKQRVTLDVEPIVDRASSFFRELTEGAYEGLVFDDDDRESNPTLSALVADREERPLSDLSDGTHDALWLALRLAVVAEAAKTTPFPLLLDDVFVHLDDRRARAALRVLATLSETVQVLLFTHHDHVVSLAHEEIPEALTVVTLATPEARKEPPAPEVRVPRHERPAAPQRAPAPRRSSEEGAVQTIVHILEEAGVPLRKQEILARAKEAGLELESDWASASKQAKDEGKIVQRGTKRGARYALAGADPQEDEPNRDATDEADPQEDEPDRDATDDARPGDAPPAHQPDRLATDDARPGDAPPAHQPDRLATDDARPDDTPPAHRPDRLATDDAPQEDEPS